MNADERGVCR